MHFHIPFNQASNAGDLMSMMMNMEEASLINSKKRNSINEMIKTAANLNFEADRHGMLQGEDLPSFHRFES